MTQVNYSSDELGFDRSWISDAAIKVVEVLQEAGFDGYLVGGCVRDLLFHRHPKDFDVTTNASPEQVRKLFKRSRVIGRRFKIVHVLIGRETIEVATYRAKPDGDRGKTARSGGRKTIAESGRVLDDNIFGTIEQDAARRDFTINALYYDPHSEEVLDFLGGVKDIRRNRLRMIGEPHDRFTEDPVRILRSLRFKGKLDLDLEEGLDHAIVECTDLLDDVPGARMFDEVIKMFHHGHAVQSWDELFEHDLVHYLFPQTTRFMGQECNGAAENLIFHVLDNTDRRVQQDKPVIPAFLFTALLWMPFREELEKQQRDGVPQSEAVWAAGDAVFARQAPQVAVPRRVSSTVIEIWEMQSWLEKRRPKAIHRLLGNKRFRAAYDFLLAREQIGEVKSELTDWWTHIQECHGEDRNRMINKLQGKPHSGKKKSRSRKQGRGGGRRSGQNPQRMMA